MDQEFTIKIYDPMVAKYRIIEDIKLYLEDSGKSNPEIKKLVSRITIHENAYSALDDSNLVAICTEWDEFNSYDWKKIYDNMKHNALVFDGRNLLDKHKLKTIGFKTFFLGQV